MEPVLLKRADVVKITGMAYSSINRRERAGRFPARRRISPNRVGWLYAEIKCWAEQLEVVVPEEVPLPTAA